MLKRIALTVLLCSMGTAALAAPRLPYALAHALNVAQSATLYALGPALKDPKEGFHGYAVTTSRSLKGVPAQKAAQAVRRAVGRAGGWSAACFVPKQGLRIVVEGRVFDYVLSFACKQMEEYEDGIEAYGVEIAGSPLVLDELLHEGR